MLKITPAEQRDVLNGQITLNDVCPCGQMMSASPCDVHCVNDVTPKGVVGKHHIIASLDAQHHYEQSE